MGDIQRDAPYFDRIIPLQVFNGPEKIRNCTLTFRIIPGTRSTLSAGQTERLIRFEVTHKLHHIKLSLFMIF
jgi:hypothetical protein